MAKKKLQTFAFLDEGSSMTLLEEGLATDLRLSGTKERLGLRWTSNMTRTERDSRWDTFSNLW